LSVGVAIDDPQEPGATRLIRPHAGISRWPRSQWPVSAWGAALPGGARAPTRSRLARSGDTAPTAGLRTRRRPARAPRTEPGSGTSCGWSTRLLATH